MDAIQEENIKEKISSLLPFLNEKLSRLYLGSEAKSLGRGGITKISKLTGVKRDTIARGINELSEISSNPTSVSNSNNSKESRIDSNNRIRKPGGGRKSIKESQPTVVKALLDLVDGNSFGNPENPLRWTTKSLRKLSSELKNQGYKIGYNVVGKLLEEEGFSLQLNQKMCQVGDQHPDRDKQFEYINNTAKKYLENNNPVVSIDCKKKENVGNFKNSGGEYNPKGEPIKCYDHDFPFPDKGKAAPYGVYDIGANEAFVNVGISADTAEFAATSLKTWWKTMGKQRYPNAKKLYITADGGGSNGSRNRLWKKCLQEIANEENIEIRVSHFPPGTSKWNKIEHRLFSQITKNWRGRSLETLDIIVNLIASTTTKTGLKVKSVLDSKIYETGIKVTDEEFAKINIERDEFCGNWNYTIRPSINK